MFLFYGKKKNHVLLSKYYSTIFSIANVSSFKNYFVLFVIVCLYFRKLLIILKLELYDEVTNNFLYQFYKYIRQIMNYEVVQE